jgi:hypothetical protein
MVLHNDINLPLLQNSNPKGGEFSPKGAISISEDFELFDEDI